jgi:hypothetical protein
MLLFSTPLGNMRTPILLTGRPPPPPCVNKYGGIYHIFTLGTLSVCVCTLSVCVWARTRGQNPLVYSIFIQCVTGGGGVGGLKQINTSRHVLLMMMKVLSHGEHMITVYQRVLNDL